MELELFVRDRSTQRYRWFRTYPIARSSGWLGPKLAEGDGQVPEGCYFVPLAALKPDSRYHLAFNIGYPNAYDRFHRRTGSSIMVHGNQVSIGCLAMTDAKIEEIYTLCAAALQGGQPFFRVHIFPFRMTADRLAKAVADPREPFWRNLKEGYNRFEADGIPPDATVPTAATGFNSGQAPNREWTRINAEHREFPQIPQNSAFDLKSAGMSRKLDFPVMVVRHLRGRRCKHGA
jgi:murein L,D-transpeptidase YafK